VRWFPAVTLVVSFVVSLVVLGLLGAGCGSESPATPPPVPPTVAATAAGVAESLERDLIDEAPARGLDYVNRSGTAEKRVILEANGAGVAVLDLGNDGDLDLVFAQGAPTLDFTDLPGLEVFENDGAGRFRRRALGSSYTAMWSTGLAAGDVDGDGDDDLVVGGIMGLCVYLQGTDGALALRNGAIPTELFTIPRAKGRALSWFTSLALFDADRDGRLDLYAGRYLDLDVGAPPRTALGEGALAIPCQWKGHTVFCGPAGLTPQPDIFLRGRGDGTFEDATASALPGHVASFTLGVHAFDADGDLDTDLFVANDTSPNLMLINDGRGVFTDFARAAGVALSSEGRMQAGMGVASADVDRDGKLDFAVTNFSDEPTELFLGAQQGFRRVTNTFGLLRETRSLLSWGVHLADFDGDGWLEMLTANGHVYPQADEPMTGTRYGQPATLWRLGPERRAIRIEPNSERSILHAAIGARGSAIGDVDMDGAVDVVLARIDAPAALGMNRTSSTNTRLALRLLGPTLPTPSAPRTPRDGHGAKAIVVIEVGAAEHALFAESHTSAGFQSSSTPWLHFGLGSARRYEKLIVRWPSGRVDTFEGGDANARIVVREGDGVIERAPFR